MDYASILSCRGCLTPVSEHAPYCVSSRCRWPECSAPRQRRQSAAPVFPLTWVRCEKCGLIQVLEDIPIPSSSRATTTPRRASLAWCGTSKGSPACWKDDTRGARRSISSKSAATMVYCSADCPALGSGPAWIPAMWPLRQPRAAGRTDLIPAPFSVALVREAGLESAVDVISGSNCLAHISNLHEVFAAAALALKPGGHLWIEVHDLHALLDGCQWDTIYHEHKVEWSEAALGACLGLHGFEWVETAHLPLHGGALRCLFRKAGEPRPLPPSHRWRNQGWNCCAGHMGHATRPRLPANWPAARPRATHCGLRGRRSGKRVSEPNARAPVCLHRGRIAAAHAQVHPACRHARRPARPPPARARRGLPDHGLNYRDDIVRKNPGHAGAWLTAFGQ